MLADFAIVLVVGSATGTALGVALLRLALPRERFGDALLLAVPAGLAAWVLVLDAARAAHLYGMPVWITLLLVLGGGAVAWGLGVRLSHLRPLAWPAAGAVVAYAYLLAPIWAKAGYPAVLGYQHNNDSVHAVVVAQSVADGASGLPPASVTNAYPSYPIGSMDLVGAVSHLVGGTAFDAFMPVLVLMVAALVFPVSWLLGRLGLHGRAWQAGGALVVVLAILQMFYVAQGSSPSMTMMVLLFAAMFLVWQAREPGAGRLAVLAGVCAGAAVTVYGFATALWFLAFAGLALLLPLADEGLGALRRMALVAAGIGVGAMFALPGIYRAWHFWLESKGEFGSGVVLGNLGGSLDPLLTLGVDRSLLLPLTAPAFAIAAALFAVAFVRALSDGDRLVMVLLGACAFTTIYASRAGPYWVAKSMSPASLAVVALVVSAAAIVIRWASAQAHRLRLIAVALGAVWIAGAGYASARVLFDAAPTPANLRTAEALRRPLTEHQPVLVLSDMGQNWAAYSLRGLDVRISGLAGYRGLPPKPYLDGFRAIVVGSGARPPAGWRPLARAGGLAAYVRDS